MLRLDPLLLAGAQSDELGIVSSPRREFGPEALLAVVASGGGVFVIAVRTGREDTSRRWFVSAWRLSRRSG